MGKQWTVLGLALVAGCTPEGSREVDGVARSVLRVQPTTSIAALGVPALAWEEQCQMEPIGGTLARRLELVELIDVHLARVRSDRGEEVVRLHGLGGSDERLPAEVNEYLLGPAREAMEAWLRETGHELVEVSPERFVPRGAVAGPDLFDREGHRIVSLGRRERGQPVHVLGSVAMARGWAWPAQPGEDPLALDPRWPFLAGVLEDEAEGVFVLAEVVDFVVEYQREAEAVAALSVKSLNELGRGLQGEVTRWLEWTPNSELGFRAAALADARPPLRKALEESRQRTIECLEEDARRMEQLSRASGGELKVELDLDLPPIGEQLNALLAEAHAFSPAGPSVWVVQRVDLTRPLLELVLVREIIRQYQEEQVSPDGGYPICGLPVGLEGAHAAWLAAAYFEYAPGSGRIDGDPRAFRLYGEISERLELGRHGLLQGFVDGRFDATLWTELVEGRMGLQEWFFRELGQVEWAGLRFEPVRNPDYLPCVRITNEGLERIDAQLQGRWLWRVDGQGRTIAGLSGPPINLNLAPGGTIVLELAREGHWQDLPPDVLTGLFSVTRPVAGEAGEAGEE